MANPSFLLCFISATLVFQGEIFLSRRGLHLHVSKRRSLIGSVMPTCTFNECRGCRYRCRAEQVPVEGNDPRNSAYHYKCVCHRRNVIARARTKRIVEPDMSVIVDV
ncbi:hypothetical protein L2E82_11779 [Cichorium intybus]|uniref:Uncharacterized protein n=1 Tax=Cichorium intybus TaxID=13427 RepID=A0ACB9GE99_CICIN|nr:hypothetical protein L2E82_11779 [Cichorium intybus]